MQCGHGDIVLPVYTGHTMDHFWAKGGGAEGKGPKMRPSKGNLKGKGKKAGLAKVTKDN